MSLSRMKPLPKAILIGALVVGIGFAVNYGIGLMPSKPVAPKVEATAVPAEGTPAAVEAATKAQAPVAPPVSQLPVDAPPILVPAGNSGIDAVLKAGKK